MRSRLNHLFALATAAIFLGACATHVEKVDGPPRHSGADLTVADLVRGSIIFGDEVAAAPRDDQALAASPTMLAFASAHSGDVHSDDGRLRTLLQAMRDGGYLAVDYDHTSTLAAPTVFDEKRGNCLSYTMMFVVLARAVGLPAQFQIVDVPPTWNANGDLVSLDEHVNALIPNRRIDTRTKRDIVVDFNLADYQGNYPSQVIPDNEVLARYYSNLGVQALTEKRFRRAFAYFKRALQEAPTLTAAWTNLGALYSQTGYPQAAVATYRHALRLDPDNPTTLNNLASHYSKQKNAKLATHFENRSRYHRLQNPYYHYQTSLTALKAGQIDRARAHLARALRLNAREHQFHFLKAQIAAIEKDYETSLRSLSRARALAPHGAPKHRYNQKMERLRAARG